MTSIIIIIAPHAAINKGSMYVISSSGHSSSFHTKRGIFHVCGTKPAFSAIKTYVTGRSDKATLNPATANTMTCARTPNVDINIAVFVSRTEPTVSSSSVQHIKILCQPWNKSIVSSVRIKHEDELLKATR